LTGEEHLGTSPTMPLISLTWTRKTNFNPLFPLQTLKTHQKQRSEENSFYNAIENHDWKQKSIARTE
jgi:hypothetical protein